jgi:hypothetical protein
MLRTSMTGLLISALASAQTPTHITPAAAASGLGNSNNVFPFSQASMGYQQVHSQNSFNNNAPALINQLRLRMASGFTNRTGYSIDVELFMAQSPNDAASANATFANNVVPATEVNVLTRKMVSLPTVPDNSWAVAPFPFDTMFTFTGNAHISWRANVYGNSNNNMSFSYPLDAFSSAGTSTVVGTGCRSATGTAITTHTVSTTGLVTGNTANFVGNSFVAAGGLPAILALGLSNTSFGSVPLPFDLTPLGGTGCSLYNDWIVVLVGATVAGANGAATIPVPIPNDPTLVNSTHYSQYAFVEPTANPLGAFTTPGRSNRISAPINVTRIYASGMPGGAMGTLGLQFGLSIGLN